MSLLGDFTVTELKYLHDNVSKTENITDEQVKLFKREILFVIRQKNLAEMMKPIVDDYIQERKAKKRLFVKNVTTLEGTGLDSEAGKIKMTRYAGETDADFRKRLCKLHIACFVRYEM